LIVREDPTQRGDQILGGGPHQGVAGNSPLFQKILTRLAG
jgi:hypothetical protein